MRPGQVCEHLMGGFHAQVDPPAGMFPAALSQI
jgi:hypothetical protein